MSDSLKLHQVFDKLTEQRELSGCRKSSFRETTKICFGFQRLAREDYRELLMEHKKIMTALNQNTIRNYEL